MANNGTIIGAGLAGLTLGVALGLLYAPHSGAETRQMLEDRAGQVRARAGEVASRVTHRGQAAAEDE